jgi:hypothetical protein
MMSDNPGNCVEVAIRGWISVYPGFQGSRRENSLCLILSMAEIYSHDSVVRASPPLRVHIEEVCQARHGIYPS